MHSASIKKLKNDQLGVSADAGTPAGQVQGAAQHFVAQANYTTDLHEPAIPANSTTAAASAGVLVGLLLARR
jgi:ElaB/YqjD/DUF883 family membrane-anchored ribosome-binding protein